MAKLTQVEQAGILEKVLASQNKTDRLERWVLQLLEALKEVADIVKDEKINRAELRAIILDIRYNMRNGPVGPKEHTDGKQGE